MMGMKSIFKGTPTTPNTKWSNQYSKIVSQCNHNIIQIHNNVSWDLHYSIEYFFIFSLNMGNMLYNSVNPT